MCAAHPPYMCTRCIKKQKKKSAFTKTTPSEQRGSRSSVCFSPTETSQGGGKSCRVRVFLFGSVSSLTAHLGSNRTVEPP